MRHLNCVLLLAALLTLSACFLERSEAYDYLDKARNAMALRRYDVARWLYMQGRTTLLEFNTSINEKDNAQRAFINALQTYWSLYYGLRSLTLKQ